MAEEFVRKILDDVEKAEGRRVEGAEPFHFAVDGVQYRVDLVPRNKAELLDVLDPYIKAGTPAKGRTKAPKGAPRPTQESPTRKSSVSKTEGAIRAQAIRDWARSQDITLSDRGRIPNSVVQAYDTRTT